MRKLKMRKAIKSTIRDNNELFKRLNDYDENGIPYWEKTGTVDPEYIQPWKFVDPWTGDAFRIIKR